MIDFPSITASISLIEVGAAAVMFVVGLVTHELMHIGVAKLFGEAHRIRVLPRESGTPIWRAIAAGTFVEVELTGTPARSHAIAVALAPTVMALAPLTGIALALSYPIVDLGTMLVLGVWFAVSIPSPQDWRMALSYRPESGIPTEVTTNGS